VAKKAKTPNLLALARRDKLVSFIHPDPGYYFVSSDGQAMEPTVTSAYSGDELYTYAAFTGLDRPVHWRDDILMVPDIYMMVASQSPAGMQPIRDYIQSLGGIEKFSEAYFRDKDATLKPLKALRTLHKVICLAAGYGARPKKLHQVLTEGGHSVSFEQCEEIYNTYWRLFSKVNDLKVRWEKKVKREGYMVTPLGYRGTPHPKDAYNFLIQSSVNPVLTLYEKHLFADNPEYIYVVRIHDEILFQVPLGVDVQEVKNAIRAAEAKVNLELKWSIPVRFGCAAGKNMYEAK
jgi:hypothetical protein